jgi:single-strand DNA-binding protein
MNSVQLTLTGNLAADPELRFTASGQPVCNFTVMTSRRVKDKQTGEWSDTDVTGWRCTAWGGLAENIAESLVRGTAVVVVGRAQSRTWETKEGDKRTAYEVTAEAVGADLRRATAKVQRVSRDTSGKPPADDPWAQPSSWPDDEPPF